MAVPNRLWASYSNAPFACTASQATAGKQVCCVVSCRKGHTRRCIAFRVLVTGGCLRVLDYSLFWLSSNRSLYLSTIRRDAVVSNLLPGLTEQT